MASFFAMILSITLLLALHGAGAIQCYVSPNLDVLGLPSAPQPTPLSSTPASNGGVGTVFQSCSQSFMQYRYPGNASGIFIAYEGWVFNGSTEATAFACATDYIAAEQELHYNWSAAALGNNVFFDYQQTTCCTLALCNNPSMVPYVNSGARLLPSYLMLMVTLLAAAVMRSMWV